MKNLNFLGLLLVLFIIIAVLVVLLPQKEIVLRTVLNTAVFLGKFVANVVCTFGIFALPPILGYLGAKFSEDNDIEGWQRTILITICSVIVFLAWILLIPFIMHEWFWIHKVAPFFTDWSGVYEKPPTLWGFYSAATFIIRWLWD